MCQSCWTLHKYCDSLIIHASDTKCGLSANVIANYEQLQWNPKESLCKWYLCISFYKRSKLQTWLVQSSAAVASESISNDHCPKAMDGVCWPDGWLLECDRFGRPHESKFGCRVCSTGPMAPLRPRLETFQLPLWTPLQTKRDLCNTHRLNENAIFSKMKYLEIK